VREARAAASSAADALQAVQFYTSATKLFFSL
jgi:hypothetical protein